MNKLKDLNKLTLKSDESKSIPNIDNTKLKGEINDINTENIMNKNNLIISRNNFNNNESKNTITNSDYLNLKNQKKEVNEKSNINYHFANYNSSSKESFETKESNIQQVNKDGSYGIQRYSPYNPNKSNSNFGRKSPLRYNSDKIFYIEALNNCKGKRHFEDLNELDEYNNYYNKNNMNNSHDGTSSLKFENIKFQNYNNQNLNSMNMYKESENKNKDNKFIDETSNENNNYKEYLNYLFDQHMKLNHKSYKLKNLKNELDYVINNQNASNKNGINFNSQSISLPIINSSENINANINNNQNSINNFDYNHKSIDKGIDTSQNNLGLYCLKVSKIRETKDNLEYVKNNQLKLKQFVPNRLGFSTNPNNQQFLQGYQKRKEFENKVKGIYYDRNLVK